MLFTYNKFSHATMYAFQHSCGGCFKISFIENVQVAYGTNAYATMYGLINSILRKNNIAQVII